MNEESNYSESKKNNKKRNIIIIVIALLLLIIAAVLFGNYIYDQQSANKDIEEISEIVETTQEVDVESVDNPYDFASLKEKNNDIYSWLIVPNTLVDYPVVQHPSDDDFYLKHSGVNKEWQSNGGIYTQTVNNKDFNDVLTVIYGHNGYKSTMFTTLHRFEKKDFFDANEFFYIYTPDEKLTYQIVSAFKFDDRHLMYSYDMQNLNVRRDFMSMIQNPESTNKNVRDIGRELTIDDKIVVLSTCITNQKSNRYLVCGVLVNNEKTN